MISTYIGNDTYKIEFLDGQKVTLNCDQIRDVKSHQFHTNTKGKCYEELLVENEDLKLENLALRARLLEIKDIVRQAKKVLDE